MSHNWNNILDYSDSIIEDLTASSWEEAEYRLLNSEVIAVIQTVSKLDLNYDNDKENGENRMDIWIVEKKKKILGSKGLVMIERKMK